MVCQLMDWWLELNMESQKYEELVSKGWHCTVLEEFVRNQLNTVCDADV